MKLFAALFGLAVVATAQHSPGGGYTYGVVAPRQVASYPGHGYSYPAPAANFGGAGFGAAGFGSPGFGAASFGAPGFGAAGFGAPGFGAAGFGAPGYGFPAPTPVFSYPGLPYSAPAASYGGARFGAANYGASASAPAVSYSTQRIVSYSAPAASYSVAASSPAASFGTTSADSADVAPAHTFSPVEGYHYKSQKRVVYRQRHRREVSAEYLPPVASYSATDASYSVPAVSYFAPAASYETYDVSASAPAHSFSEDDGYRYKIQRHRVVTRRNRF